MSCKLVRSVRCSSGRIYRLLALAAAVAAVAAGSRWSWTSETASSEPKKISVGRMVFCLSIEDREPKEVAEEFPNDVDKVFCFTAIVNAGAETHVVHKWYYGEELMAEVTLKAQGEYWRTWSAKHMVAGWTGTWRVDVVSADGKVLKSASFEFVAAEAADQGQEVETEDAETDEEPGDETPDDGKGDDTGTEDEGNGD